MIFTFIRVTSYWVWWRLKSPASPLFTQPFIQVQIKKASKLRSLVFARGIHWWPVNSPHKWPVTPKMLPFDDVIMYQSVVNVNHNFHLDSGWTALTSEETGSNQSWAPDTTPFFSVWGTDFCPRCGVHYCEGPWTLWTVPFNMNMSQLWISRWKYWDSALSLIDYF